MAAVDKATTSIACSVRRCDRAARSLLPKVGAAAGRGEGSGIGGSFVRAFTVVARRIPPARLRTLVRFAAHTEEGKTMQPLQRCNNNRTSHPGDLSTQHDGVDGVRRRATACAHTAFAGNAIKPASFPPRGGRWRFGRVAQSDCLGLRLEVDFDLDLRRAPIDQSCRQARRARPERARTDLAARSRLASISAWGAALRACVAQRVWPSALRDDAEAPQAMADDSLHSVGGKRAQRGTDVRNRARSTQRGLSGAGRSPHRRASRTPRTAAQRLGRACPQGARPRSSRAGAPRHADVHARLERRFPLEEAVRPDTPRCLR